MMIVRDRINEWVEETGMLGDVQGGFRRGRRTEDNLFMLERMMEMAKVRGECLYIGFMDMEKAYDRVIPAETTHPAMVVQHRAPAWQDQHSC